MNNLRTNDNPTIAHNSILEQRIVNMTKITEVKPFEIGIFKSGTNYASISHISTLQISTNEPSQTQFGIAEISPTQISPTQISCQQISSTQVSPAQVSPTQVSLFQINPTKVSLSSSIPLKQLLSIHNSTPTSVNSYKDNPLNLWQTLLDPTFNIDLEITDLPTGQLSEAVITKFDSLGRPNGGTLLIDHNANGIGWYIDPTPLDHSEFTTTLTDTAFRATTNSPAAGHYDLLTTLLHEMGHLSGFISGYNGYDNHIQTLNSSQLFVGDNFSATLTPDKS